MFLLKLEYLAEKKKKKKIITADSQIFLLKISLKMDINQLLCACYLVSVNRLHIIESMNMLRSVNSPALVDCLSLLY